MMRQLSAEDILGHIADQAGNVRPGDYSRALSMFGSPLVEGEYAMTWNTNLLVVAPDMLTIYTGYIVDSSGLSSYETRIRLQSEKCRKLYVVLVPLCLQHDINAAADALGIYVIEDLAGTV